MKNKFLVFLVSLCLVPSSFAANIPMDYMEYANEGAAQAAYVIISGTVDASGGTETTDGDYTVHTFTSSGTFSVTTGGSVEYMVIGGGGGGGGYVGAGGGAGAYLVDDDYTVTVQDYTVTIGNGGAGGTGIGNKGQDTVFGSITAEGGGAGAGASGQSGGHGGSGGGGGYLNGAGGTSNSGEGNDGGIGDNNGSNGCNGGGGGGAGHAGYSGVSGTDGDGGEGVANDITGTSLYYAGGGGGAEWGGSNDGVGGSDVGGDGGDQGTDGATNTGSGGGGSENTTGGAGAKGIVVIRYLTPTDNFSVTSEGTIKTQGSYSLKGVADDAAINQYATKTVTPTLNLSDQKMLKFDIRSSRTGSNIKIGIHDSGGTTTETTPNVASANTWQTVVWDISAVSNANKDAIDKIVITIVNDDSANTFYLDNFRCSVANDVFGSIE